MRGTFQPNDDEKLVFNIRSRAVDVVNDAEEPEEYPQPAWLVWGRASARPYTAQLHFTKRLYFFRTSCRRSWGRAMAVWPSMPVMVSAATMALMTASSVACTVARNRESSLSLGSIFRSRTPLGAAA